MSGRRASQRRNESGAGARPQLARDATPSALVVIVFALLLIPGSTKACLGPMPWNAAARHRAPKSSVIRESAGNLNLRARRG